MTVSIWDMVHKDYPRDWAVIGPIVNFGDRVIYSGSQEKVRGASGVITAITHVKKSSSFGAIFEWRYAIAIDDGKNSGLTNVREESFTKA
jgi:hypothetical protein